MDRETYLKELRIALQGQIPQERVNEHLRYYENYIIEESRKGRTESQVMEDLGNPRLIAKTIIDTTDKVYTDQTPLEEEEKPGGNRIKAFQVVKLAGLSAVLILMLILIAHVALLLLPIFLPIVIVTGIVYFLFFSNRK